MRLIEAHWDLCVCVWIPAAVRLIFCDSTNHILLQDREWETLRQKGERERNMRFSICLHSHSVPGPTSKSVSHDFPIYEFLYLAAQASQKGLVFITFCLLWNTLITVTVTGHLAPRLLRLSLVLTLLEESTGAIFYMAVCSGYHKGAKNDKCFLEVCCYFQPLHFVEWLCFISAYLQCFSDSSSLQYTLT